MSRALWFAAGTTAGVYGAVKARRLAYRLSPGGVTDQLAAVGVGLRALVDDVKAESGVRAEVLRAQIGLEPRRTPDDALTARRDTP